MNANKEAKQLLDMSPEGLEEYIADELSAIDTTGDRKRSAYLGMALRVLREIRGGGVRDAKELATAFSKVASDLIERAAPAVQATEEAAEESFWASIADDVPEKVKKTEDQSFLGGVGQRAAMIEMDEATINEKAKELARQVLKEVPKEARQAAEKRKIGESVKSPAFKREKLRCGKAKKYFDLRRKGISREDAAAMSEISRSTAKKYDHNGPMGFRVAPRYANNENLRLRLPPMCTKNWPPKDVVDRCIMDKVEYEKRIEARKDLSVEA